MRIIIFLIVTFQLNQISNAQNLSRFDYFFGYGFYEGLNIGSEYFFKSYKQSISTSIGYDKFIDKKQESFALTIGYNFAIFRKHKNDSNAYKWHINNNVVLWQLEDDYYIWKAISLIPSINRKFILCRNLSLSFDIGPSFNIVLYNKRKTYKEVGWPYHVMPDFRILLIF